MPTGKPDRYSALRAKKRLKDVLATDRVGKEEPKHCNTPPVRSNRKKRFELSNDIFDQQKDKEQEPERLNRLSNEPKDPL